MMNNYDNLLLIVIENMMAAVRSNFKPTILLNHLDQ